MRYWAQGIFGYSPSKLEGANSGSSDEVSTGVSAAQLREAYEKGERTLETANGVMELEKVADAINIVDPAEPKSVADPYFGINHGGLKHEVTIESELVFEDDIASIKMETDHGGHFAFAVPAYYGQAILFMKAYDTDMSEKKQKRMNSKGMLDESDWPEYYVKRDLFYPVFAKKYSWYQCHLPSDDQTAAAAGSTDGSGSESADEGRLSMFDRELSEVTVKKKRRRGRHAIDYSKPACVYDAQWLYNLATDRGLSFGRYQPDRFPIQVAMALLGNYNSDRPLQVMARQNNRQLTPYVYYRNYDPGSTTMEQFVSDAEIERNSRLKRMDEVRLYTDFELRNEDKHVEQQTNAADVTLDVMLVADEPGDFTVGDKTFLLNGQPFIVKAAEVHYPRIPRPYWEHRIKMCKALGMNAVCIYIFWNIHEQREGQFDFTGNNDVAEFCRLAQKNGMYVIVRPGPYVCAEWEMGGLPWWLLKKKDIRLRERDPYFMERVKIFEEKVGEQLKPLTIQNGGPIIMIQVENEYGSYGEDKPYVSEIRDCLRGIYGKRAGALPVRLVEQLREERTRRPDVDDELRHGCQHRPAVPPPGRAAPQRPEDVL